MLNDSPEIIIISDSEEVSLDLFSSTADEDGSIDANPDSDDLFSPTNCDSENNEKNDNDSRTDDASRQRKADNNCRIQCSSSVFNSVYRDHIKSPSRKSKVKSDPWTSKHMNKIAEKLEEREKITKALTRKDEEFFTVVPGNGLDFSEKKGKAMLISGTTARKKADRAKLQGVACAASKAYFDALELSPESKERRINEVSRVRVVAQHMPKTPENYWEVGFPSESEQRRRGLIKEVHVRNKKGRNLFH